MKLPLTLLLTALGFLSSCDCEPFYLVDGSTFAFRLIDEPTGENLFTSRFDPFELDIIDDNGDTVDIDSYRLPLNGDYGFIVDPTGGKSFRYDQQMRRTYYLQLDSLDTDTLELFFVPRSDDCEEHMDDFEAYYNDKLFFEGSGKTSYQGPDVLKP